ncbi:molybdopterin-guanine dinucleotide biosynthesis protein B [Clostridium sp. CTA-5]
MPIVVNIVGQCSNVGKTTLIEGLIKELKKRKYSVGTIKHDIHGFDIDKKGKDTYRHRKAGADEVIISSKNRLAIIKELKEEINLEDIIEMMKDKDVILVEGYKNSNLKKIEVYRYGYSTNVITESENLICIATDFINEDGKYLQINKDHYSEIADIILKTKD